MRILMVSTEYPPMPGGVGRYTSNLTNKLRELGVDVIVLCNKDGNGQFSGLSPTNTHNSEVLSSAVSQAKPDVVHIQFEPGMYGLVIDPRNPKYTGTYIDKFYKECKDVPIVTTFHTSYTLRQWLSIASLIKKNGRIGKLGVPLRFLNRLWKYSLNFEAFKKLNKQKLSISRTGITFSYYMANLLGGGQVIYHGAEPAIFPRPTKREARDFFSLSQQKRIALVIGFKTATKGWDILKEMKVPEGWMIVINSSRSYYNKENYEIGCGDSSGINACGGNSTIKNDDTIIDLQRGFLSDKELSMLLYAADAVLLPYTVTAASGVMFDAMAHGLPFIATDLKFFKEFASQGLGIAVKRRPKDFSDAIKKLDTTYFRYTEAVDKFKNRTKWNTVARRHISVYNSITKKEKITAGRS